MSVNAAKKAGESAPQLSVVPKSLKLATAVSLAPLLAAHGALAESGASIQERVEALPQAAIPALALFTLAFPGVYSQIKRAPKANVKRVTFELPGPNAPNPMPLDKVAQMLFNYFIQKNYVVKDRGEVITFAGKYAADKGQAAFITAFTFLSFMSLGLVLSTMFPEKGGNAWYGLSLISPAAGSFVMKNGEREEEFKIKMTSSTDGKETDIFVEGDIEEIERMQTELGLVQKGKVKVKGLFERDDAAAPSS